MEGTCIQLGLCSISEARDLVLGRDQERAQSWGLMWRQEQRKQRNEKGCGGGVGRGRWRQGLRKGAQSSKR